MLLTLIWNFWPSCFIKLFYSHCTCPCLMIQGPTISHTCNIVFSPSCLSLKLCQTNSPGWFWCKKGPFSLIYEGNRTETKKMRVLRPVQTHSTLYTIQHSTCILYKVECVWTPYIVHTIHDSTSLIVYSDVWNWSNLYSTTTRLFLCFAITEAILYKVELVWTHHSTSRALFYVISMETRVELWVILTHNSLFRHTCRVVVYSVYSAFEQAFSHYRFL